jgi:hypothetical protein
MTFRLSSIVARILRPFLPKLSQKDLPKLLNILEKRLIDDIPKGVKGMKVTEPVYGMFLMYFDGRFDEFTPHIWIVPVSKRVELIAKFHDEMRYYQESVNKPIPGADFEAHKGILEAFRLADVLGGYYFSPTSFDTPFEYHPPEPQIRKMCQASYDLIFASDSDASLDDEWAIYKPFRDMMCRVARRMNEHDWTGVLNRTDDFVAFAVNATEVGAAADFKNSVPYDRRLLLRSRKLIEQNWLE